MVNTMCSFPTFPTLSCRRSVGVGIFISPCVYNPAGSFRSPNSMRGHRLAISWGFKSTKPISSSGSLPRLMLPALFSGGGGAELLDCGTELERGGGDELLELVGISHGWVALFNKRSNDLFLSDPHSHRRINLPPVNTLPDPEFNLDQDGHWSVSKVILSSSPENDDCRAMMTFGPGNRLAFCLPGRSSEWTPIDQHFVKALKYYPPREKIAVVHEDLVYCSRRKVFTSITAGYLDLSTLYLVHADMSSETMRCDWDIQDPDLPKLFRSEALFVRSGPELYADTKEVGVREGGKRTYDWMCKNRTVLEKECVQILHLVYAEAEQSDQLFIVVQFVRLMNEDGESPLGFVPTCELKGLNGLSPGTTFGFVVMEMIEEENKNDRNRYRLYRLVDDLNGMSMFVGINHSVAISASDNGELKPNSIYFNDSNRIKRVRGLNDDGVFDYETKTISTPSYEEGNGCFGMINTVIQSQLHQEKKYKLKGYLAKVISSLKQLFKSL